MTACPTVQRDFHRLVNMKPAEILSMLEEVRASKAVPLPRRRA